MKTLGYSESQIYRKLDVAKIQLVESIELFVEEKFIASLTLAGAAEEVFAGLLRGKGQQPIIEETMEYINFLGRQLNVDVMAEMDKKETFSIWNHARNRSKHHNSNENEEIRLNYCDEAYWMLKRAIANGKSLGCVIDSEQDFENWLIINVC